MVIKLLQQSTFRRYAAIVLSPFFYFCCFRCVTMFFLHLLIYIRGLTHCPTDPEVSNQVLVDCWSGILCRADTVDKYWFRNHQSWRAVFEILGFTSTMNSVAANKHHCQNLFLPSTAATANPSTSWTGSHCKSCSGTSHVKNRLNASNVDSLHHLLPDPREQSLTSRLRTFEKYPRTYTRTRRYCSFINHALNNYQDKMNNT